VRSPAWDAWVEKARSVRLEDAIGQRNIKLNGGIERCGPCPVCGGDDRFSISTSKQLFNCRVCNAGGDVIDLVQFIDGADFTGACETLTGEPPPKANGKANGKAYSAAKPRNDASKIVVAEFPYHDTNGALAFVVERVEYQSADGSFVMKEDSKRKKTFPQKRPKPDCPGEWIWNVDGIPPLVYRLPEVAEAIANGHTIIITEGEAKADLLWSWNIPATCCSQGAGKWKAEHSEQLRGADIIIVPDNDQPGRDHRDVVGRSLSGIASSIRTIELPVPEKGDIINWAKAGGTVEQLHKLIEHEAKPWTPSGDGSNMQRESTNAALAGDPFTEDALALRFSKRHADDLRYIATKGCWQKWDGARWYEEATHLAFDLARQSCRDDAQTFGNGKPPASVLAAKTIAAVERMAKADRRHATTIEEWDADDMLFNAGD
jgi:putative DNA primase/helicase